ncbi:MAG: hypothetical protein L0I76_18430, partial [Pseudonocardia sp.]|nr:hypothetical protein [Pseudonocardia sp.]
MQSHEPPGADDRAPRAGSARADAGHARHRRRRTDPPTPTDGTPLIRQEPLPRTVGEYVSRQGDPGGGDPTGNGRAPASGRYRAVTVTPPSGSRPAEGPPAPEPGPDVPATAPRSGHETSTGSDHRVDPEYRARRDRRSRDRSPEPDSLRLTN